MDINIDDISQLTDNAAVAGFEVSPDQKNIYYLSSSVGKPDELYSLNISAKNDNPITSLNKDFLEKVDVRPAEKIWVTGDDGIKVEVFIVKPHNFDPDRKYPLILNVHGGPQGQWEDSFRGDWQIYPGSGYVVAFPNPHGSTGYGSKYTEEISGDYGGKVFQDLMKVIDLLETLSYIDTSRVGAMGCSFGGYMMTLRSLGIDSRLIIFKNDGQRPDVVKSMPLYYNAHLE